ncbi:MAG: OmpA family protein [Akkermansiaceae bacterium]|nr:OmpA family protein [Akkermansiaceae bacterium]
MANGYSWSDARDGGTYRLPGPEHLGWWAAVAMLFSVLLHVLVFLVLDYMRIGLGFSEMKEMTTAPMTVKQVEVEMRPEDPIAPEDVVVPPNDAAALLEEIDLLAKLPVDQEIDIRPDVLAPEYALRMTNPAREGEPLEVAPDLSAGFDIEADLPDLGRMEEKLPPAADGQITVDPGAVQVDDVDLKKFTDEMVKQGANGKVREGALDGVTSLDDLIGLPANVLVSKKTMLPSDLLFEFNSAELRESAKVGLMKLGLLIDRNPGLYCWVEGHTDLVGTDEANLDLSRRRAAAVREYLVESLRMEPSKILTRGKGKFEPLVPGGTVDEQALNRRVEIRMRKEPPPPEPVRVVPKAVPAPAPVVTPPPPRAAPVPPPRALPVEDPPAPPPRAVPVQEVPRAEPVDPDDLIESPPMIIPRAEPLDE